MGFRFRKRIRVLPGVDLNLNKKSVGVSVGRKGMHYTVNSKGRRTTSVGIPGTGLSHQTISTAKRSKKNRGRPVVVDGNDNPKVFIGKNAAKNTQYCPKCQAIVVGPKRRSAPLVGFLLHGSYRCPNCRTKLEHV